MEDTRRQRRIPLRAEAKVIKLNGGDRANADLINVSNYGASLKTTVPLKTNERIKVSITTKKQYHVMQTEEVPGTVRYVERTKGIYLAGIKSYMFHAITLNIFQVAYVGCCHQKIKLLSVEKRASDYTAAIQLMKIQHIVSQYIQTMDEPCG